MTWGAVAGAAIGAVGSAVSARKQKKAAAQAADQQGSAGTGAGAAQAAGQQSRSDIEWVNDLNRQNALWAQKQNAVNQTTDFGSTNYEFDPTTGRMSAKQSLAPEQQAMLSSLRGQQASAIGGMDSNQFDVNNDVMNAYRAVNQPMIDQQRNKENARLAAMGLGTGSGSAWGQSQDALNRNQVNADQSAILQGNQAWLAGQQNNRANLGAVNATEQGWAGMAPSLAPPQVAATTVGQPQNATMQGFMADQNQANTVYGQQMNQQNQQNDYTGQIAGIAGGLAGNKDVQGAVKNWWDTPSAGTTPSNGGDTDMTGFYTNPWA